MSSLQHTHAMLLSLQLASIFKHVADLGVHRESYGNFQMLEGEHGDIVTFVYGEGGRKGRSYVDAFVNTEENGFRFRQHYNFGLLLELSVSYLHADGEYLPLFDAIIEQSGGEAYIKELMIDYEYAISILTEHVARSLDDTRGKDD